MTVVAISGVHAWADSLPASWRKDWLKWSVTLSTERPTDEDVERLPYIANEDIESWTGKLLNPEPKPVEADSRVFFRNDVLFNKLRPYLAKVYHAEFDGLSSGELLCLRASVFLGRFRPGSGGGNILLLGMLALGAARLSAAWLTVS